MVLLSVAAEEGREDTLAALRALDGLRKNGRNRFVLGVGGGLVEAQPEAFAESGYDFSARDLRTFALEFLPEIESKGTVTPQRSNSATTNV
jgi:hypothetical protein